MATPMRLHYNNSGRMKTGRFRAKYGSDCVTRAISIATARDPFNVTGEEYQAIADKVNELGKRERITKRKRGKSNDQTGVYKATCKKLLLDLGWVWTPTMHIGSGCRVHLAEGELPSEGRLIVSLSKHMVAVVDGVIHDTGDPTRGGTRCVYGYWQEEHDYGT